jgi:hypothetical protein
MVLKWSAVEKRRSKSVRTDPWTFRVSWHVSLGLKEMLPAKDGDASYTLREDPPARFIESAMLDGTVVSSVEWRGSAQEGKDNALDYPVSARLSYLYESNCINSTTFKADVSLLQWIETVLLYFLYSVSYMLQLLPSNPILP